MACLAAASSKPDSLRLEYCCCVHFHTAGGVFSFKSIKKCELAEISDTNCSTISVDTRDDAATYPDVAMLAICRLEYLAELTNDLCVMAVTALAPRSNPCSVSTNTGSVESQCYCYHTCVDKRVKIYSVLTYRSIEYANVEFFAIVVDIVSVKWVRSIRVHIVEWK